MILMRDLRYMTINIQSGTTSARNGSTAFFDNGANSYHAKQQKEKNRRQGK